MPIGNGSPGRDGKRQHSIGYRRPSEKRYSKQQIVCDTHPQEQSIPPSKTEEEILERLREMYKLIDDEYIGITGLDAKELRTYLQSLEEFASDGLPAKLEEFERKALPASFSDAELATLTAQYIWKSGFKRQNQQT